MPLRVTLFALAGLIIGSFLTVVVDRIPKGESFGRSRSRCAACGVQVGARDNVPLVSYLLLKGRCRACGDRISLLHPGIELGTAGLFGAAGGLVEPLYASVMAAGFLAVLLAVAVIDAEHRIVPNRIMYPSFVVGVIAVGVGDAVDGGVELVPALLGALVFGGPLLILALLVPGGMGMGDVKLAGFMGLVLGGFGLRLVAAGAAVGVLAGGLGAIVAVIGFGYGRKAQIPFGPFLALGGGVAVLAGDPIADAYLSILG